MIFDFVVVGGGTSGSLVAARLLEAKAGSVLVLEAGRPPHGSSFRIPAAYHSLFGSEWDWNVRSTSQKGLHGRSLAMPRGKCFGGCSQINAMIYCRGSKSDMLTYPSFGLDQWSADDCQEAYSRSVSLQTAGDMEYARRCDSKQHSIPVTQPELQFESSDLFLKAAEELGWTRLDHGSVDAQIGCWPYLRCQALGRRVSAWDAFLRPMKNHDCIRILQEAEVECIHLANDRATGVRFRRHGMQEDVQASQAVILCAGAFESPKLLLRSGIGDRQRLKSARVPCRVDLPGVGENLIDHLAVPIIWSVPSDRSAPRIADRDHRWTYAKTRSGPLASNLAEVGGFGTLRSGCRATESDEPPDFQIHVTPNHYLEYPLRPQPTSALSLVVTWLRPTSRGRISMVAPEGKDTQFQIDPAYLSTEDDVDHLVQSTQLVRRLGESTELQRTVLGELFPGPRIQSAEHLERWIRRVATTLFHPVGTCRMGYDSMGVVDGQLKVRGIDRLFIADASVLPEIPRANTQAATMMVAERCCDFLLSIPTQSVSRLPEWKGENR